MLYDAFVGQMDGSLSTPGIGEERQEPHFARGKHFIGVLDRHILGNTQSVVFTMEAVGSDYLLRFFLPLYAREYKKLTKSNYLPVLRSKHYLAVGCGEHRGIRYACCAVKFPSHRGAHVMFNALQRLSRELEKYVSYANMGVMLSISVYMSTSSGKSKVIKEPLPF